MDYSKFRRYAVFRLRKPWLMRIRSPAVFAWIVLPCIDPFELDASGRVQILAPTLGPQFRTEGGGDAAAPSNATNTYHFDQTISREVLENYLSRAITMEGLLNGRGDLEDNIRMLKSIGAKFIGRSLCLWGGEANLLRNLERAKQQLPRVHAIWAAGRAGPESATPERDMILWYRQPAEKWLEAMPMGNGMIGAMVFGGIQQERIALNESSFWSGRPHDYDNPGAFKYFPRIRDLVFDGKFQEAETMADEHFYGVPAAQQAFQPLGNSLAPNLHNSGSNQSDASFGLTAGVAEALLQSHADEISLLPALPVSWRDGSVKGLRARGGLEVSMRWQDGKLQSAQVRPGEATACKVRYGERTAEFSLKPGQAIRLNAELVVIN